MNQGLEPGSAQLMLLQHSEAHPTLVSAHLGAVLVSCIEISLVHVAAGQQVFAKKHGKLK